MADCSCPKKAMGECPYGYLAFMCGSEGNLKP